jgi:cellulose synthase/poly-beta-1,6-N-acetylglucosamine synthase-like glycosyltransferase
MTPLLSLAGAILLAVTLPLTLELLLLSGAAMLPSRRRRVTLAPPSFQLAAIVPAHNEAALIADCVQSLLASGSGEVCVYVIAHNCTDRTSEIAFQAGATVLPLEGPGGKGLALDHGFRQALENGADGVLVVDADSTVSPNLVHSVAAALAAGADAVQTRYQVANDDANPRTQLMALAFLGMNVLRPRGRDRLGLSCGIFGNGFALSAATLDRVPYTANSLVEDLESHLRLVSAGLRVEFLDSTTVLGEMPEKSPAAATQRARWEGGRALMRRQWTLPLVRSVLGGKARLLEPLLDLLSLPLATQAGLLFVAALLPIAWLRCYSAASFLAIVFYVLVSAGMSPSPIASLRALAATPAYLAWKLLMLPSTRLAARKDAAWVRTQRNADPGEPK